MTLLSLSQVSKRFGGVVAVDTVDLAVHPGEILGLIGANGAGKTTLFSLIAGNERPSSGEIHFDGARIDGLAPDRICRRGIARAFQIVRPFAEMTVLENVMVGALFGKSRIKSQTRAEPLARAVLEETGLGARADSRASQLTLAGRKRLEIARALATQPRLVLLDEVMAGLTPTEIDEAVALIQRAQKRYGLTVIVIEHVMRALMRLAERVVVLHHGAKLAEGTPAEVTRNPVVIDAYFGGRRP
jgi:branched-chain amino acid transport system ATP-binding protein